MARRLATVTVATLAELRPRRVRAPIDAEALLRWVYGVQRAHLVADRGLAELTALRGGSSSTTDAVARVLSLGVIVDTSAPDRGELHPDAEAVHGVVRQLDKRREGISRAGLLILNAAAGERPECFAGVVPRPGPMLTDRGRVHVEWSDPGRRLGMCPLVYDPSAERIRQGREEYAEWHAGLRLVALALQSVRLELWQVLAPAAPERPWQ